MKKTKEGKLQSFDDLEDLMANLMTTLAKLSNDKVLEDKYCDHDQNILQVPRKSKWLPP